jgi:(p)ppGpp synthase/HD superfamily hydrolase
MTHTAASTIRITLPDGSVREAASGTTPLQVAEGIGARLAKAALAARVDGEVVEVTRPIDRDARLELLTERLPEWILSRSVSRSACSGYEPVEALQVAQHGFRLLAR